MCAPTTNSSMPPRGSAQYPLHSSNGSSDSSGAEQSADDGAFLNAMYDASVHRVEQSGIGRLMAFPTIMPMHEVFRMALVYTVSILNGHSTLERNLTHAPFTLQFETHQTATAANPQQWCWSIMNGAGAKAPVLIYVALRETRRDQYVFTLEMMFPMPKKEAITTSQPFSSRDGPTLLTKLVASLRGLLYS